MQALVLIRRRKWQPTPVFLPGESHGQRGLVGYSLRGCKESDKTETELILINYLVLTVYIIFCFVFCILFI